MSESDIRGGVGVVPDLASLIRATNCGLSASLRAQRSNPSFGARGDNGLLRCARNDGGYSFAFSRRIAPEVCIFVCPPLELEGAGKTGCAPHPRSRVPFAHSKNAHEHTGSAETLRPSLRNGFTAYFGLSPVNGSFATVARERRASREFDTSTAASGPHDLAVRVSLPRQSWLPRPSHLTARS